jgi:hypothetical protein
MLKMMLMMMLTIMLLVMPMMLLVGNAIHDITSPFNNVFHKEQPWVCLDNVNEIFSRSPWCLISV